MIIFFGEEEVILKGGWIGAWIDLIGTKVGDAMLFSQNFSVDHEITTEVGALRKDSVRGIGHNMGIVEKLSRIGGLWGSTKTSNKSKFWNYVKKV